MGNAVNRKSQKGSFIMDEQKLYERITSVEQSVKSAHRRVDEICDDSKNVTEILVEMKYMRRDLNELLARVSTIEKRPGRKYDVIVSGLITAVIAAAVSLFVK